MPGISNPQSLNRYSYVTNNPVRYADPTGHMRVTEGSESNRCSDPKYCSQGKPKPKEELKKMRDGNKDKAKGGGAGKSLPMPKASSTSNSYCGGGSNGLSNILDCGANVTQDLALAIDTPFAALEAILITAGCFAGPEGCAAGAGVADTVFNVTGANFDETVLSLTSAGFSALADFTDDGHLGGSTGISAIAAVAGLLSPDPILDFAIDGFGSAYNHEVKPIFDLPSRVNSLFSH